MEAIFYISAGVAILSTILVITHLDAVHAVLLMILSLLSVAVIFYTLGAHFIAVLEVIIYGGAIMVLFVFVVMMLNLGPRVREQERQWFDPRTWRIPAILALVLLAELVYILTRGIGTISRANIVTPRQVSVSLFGLYLIGVELASILLLSGLVGAYHLGRREKERSLKAGMLEGPEARGGRQGEGDRVEVE